MIGFFLSQWDESRGRSSAWASARLEGNAALTRPLRNRRMAAFSFSAAVRRLATVPGGVIRCAHH